MSAAGSRQGWGRPQVERWCMCVGGGPRPGVTVPFQVPAVCQACTEAVCGLYRLGCVSGHMAPLGTCFCFSHFAHEEPGALLDKHLVGVTFSDCRDCLGPQVCPHTNFIY